MLKFHTQKEVKEIEDTRLFLASIVDSTDDAIIRKTLEGIIISWNKAAENLYQYTAEEMIGETIDLLVPIERKQELFFIAEKLNKGECIKNFETIRIRKDGVGIDVSLIDSPIKNKLGSIIGSSTIVRDITRQKKIENELKRLNDELESRITERTAELENKIKELQSFSYSVSHDLRAPLRYIDGFSLALLEDYGDKLDETGINSLKKIRYSTQRMGLLIDDMLSLSHLSQSKFNSEEVNLSEMVKEITNELQKNEPQREAIFKIEDNISTLGDKSLLEIMFYNLLSNAWKFTSKNKKTEIKFGKLLDKEGGFIYFLTDNGAGFDMQYVNKLFIPFQRLHTEKEFPGTGIGLAIIQRIVSRHHGKIWAESSPKLSTTFYFRLNGDKV